MDIFREIASSMKGKNVFISPASISSVLTILYYGANGSTAEQLSKYVEKEENMDKVSAQNISFKSMNKVYGRYSAVFKDSFLGKIGDKFQTVDFTDCRTIDAINKCVDIFTEGKINPLLDEPLSPDTCLLAISAVYFKAKWLIPFEKEFTSDYPFYVSPTEMVDVSMMSIYGEPFNHASVKESFGNFSIIELPYVGDTSMMVILPNKIDGLESIEQNLTDTNFKKWCNSLEATFIDVHIPKFKVIGSYNLVDTLIKLGLTDVFYSTGDYINMCNSDVSVDAMIHKTYIDVNEEYTEAAAATSVLVADCASTVTNEFCADHPFIYVIRHVDGKILFVGRYCSPTTN
ncbi:bifunctional SPI-2/CrmA protein/IL-1 convertase [Monkeypox virus]|uniref:Serine proteinase inhibitor 2 n=1 Tax=Monkeypox virus TaxID=10244 RepID=Q3I8I5_MONPV|nr:bifunctional SPI-2/CrmA protein/IL-1 convertase [Monkeypox virus]ADK39203.1 bifunctional SPI-2/CrmA protein/IL-1 convertase [Monkeypox virus]ADX22825.1 bifunctional SPI-2/CrmA protein/IL-1 convertase [Monkeypox virus]ADX23021.1 bifunctional SPI-2/CrmA protein/IL-1 convertase [Monkeypox virus]